MNQPQLPPASLLVRNPFRSDHPIVIPGLDPGIACRFHEMAGSSPAMTNLR
jgi:hypothetical protein